ncbi:MAG: hypothetical protein ACXWPK_10230 [Isosphaeraceae bacterium]
MEPIRPGTLVRDADGFYAIVLRTYHNGALEICVSNGVRTLTDGHRVTPLGLRVGDPANPPASFQDIIDPRVLP